MSERCNIIPFDSGDLSGIPHSQRIDILNAAFARMLDARRNEGGYDEVYQQRANELDNGINEQRSKLIEEDTKQNLLILADKFRPIHENTSLSPIEMLGECMAVTNTWGVVSDSDRSMTKTRRNTDNTWGPEKEYLVPNVPASILFEEYLDKNGREQFTQGFVEIMQELLREYADVFEEAGRQATVYREGVVELFDELRIAERDRIILSANWESFILGGLSNTILSQDSGLRVIGITHNNITSKDKSTKLQLLAAENPNRSLIFIGDGASDMNALDAYNNHAIAGIFALKNSEFDLQLTAANIPHMVYDDYNDIRLQLQEAQKIAQQRKSQAA